MIDENEVMMKKREPEFDPTRVRDLSVEVYKMSLGEDDTRRMLEKDDDGGVKLRERAGSYDALTRRYMRALTGT